MPELEAPRLVFLVVMLMFFYLSPDLPQSTPSQRREHGSKVNEAKEALAGLSNSTYGQFDPIQDRWLNLIGLKEEDGYSWDRLPDVKEAARDQLLSIQSLYGKDAPDPDEKSYEDARKVELSVYQNVSGSVQGHFLMTHPPVIPKINLTALVPSNEYVSNEFSRNVTEKEGEISFRFVEEKLTVPGPGNSTTSFVVADSTVTTDSSPGSGWDLRLYGFHVHDAGLIVLSTTSEKFDGIFALPQLALTREDFEASKSLLNKSIADTIRKWEDFAEGSPISPWSSNAFDGGTLFPTPACEFVIYLQLHPVFFPVVGDDLDLLRAVEKEMRFPMGSPIARPPPMTMSASIFSPDCGFMLASRGLPESHEVPNHLSGPRREVFWALTRNLILALLIILGFQIALIKRQVDEASTPSTRSRISYQSIGIMAMGDGLMVSALVGFLMINQSVFLLVAAASFLCFFNLAIMEMRFIFDIWTVQVGDVLQRMRERERQQAQSAARQADPTSIPTARDATPAPIVPTDTGATPVILPPDQEIEAAAEEDERLLPTTNPQTTTTTPQLTPPRRIAADFGTIYARFYFTILATVLISIWAYSWPKPLRSAYANLLAFIYLSFWIPQIYRNTMRNCRKALRWEYVFGISVCRLVPIIYCYAKERNTFSIVIDPTGALLLTAWVWIQVLILLSQQFLGPRLFVKDSWCPPAYDYHPILRDDADDPEAGTTLPIGFVASASEARDSDSREKGKSSKSFDCAICMQEIEVPVVSKTEGEGRGASWLGRTSYMVTPCRHIFHSGCLEGWMRLRLVCPICREGLPPV